MYLKRGSDLTLFRENPLRNSTRKERYLRAPDVDGTAQVTSTIRNNEITQNSLAKKKAKVGKKIET